MKKIARLSVYSLLLSVSLFSFTSCQREEEITPTKPKSGVVQDASESDFPPTPIIRR
ncbi:hypothetical protein [Siphonobacter sp. SORGH_AS_1065]|uniref:hypothetical protein n=1 Tax=Siphonobacter sp. SORGH_AS_1065 TaxID=3041795 RepID=UPI0018E3217F|nr:hypothetical protein [Siphonobacter sp. SORGH_AS_1065]MDQ1086268.1 hypothetical protein [Siphonobacter sp. SORGH_AS_1065]